MAGEVRGENIVAGAMGIDGKMVIFTGDMGWVEAGFAWWGGPELKL